MTRLDITSVKTGMRFSKPVFFDDGRNMFIESGVTVKPYHMSSLTRWNVPFLLTEGHPLAEGEELPVEPQPKKSNPFDSVIESENIEEIEDFDEVEDLDDVEEIEEL